MSHTFQGIYQQEFEEHFYASGRVNLIGEHIDYNGGTVLPVGISLGIHMWVRKREDNFFNLYSENFSDAGVIQYSTGDKIQGWAQYPAGVITYLSEIKALGHGLDIFYEGFIPTGAGLSSSAAIEIVTASALNEIYNLGLESLDLVKCAMKVENEWVGVQTGIMDQFAIAFAKKDHAIHLNTASLDYSYIPFDLKGLKLVVMNTNKMRTLVDSKYDQRFQECQEALKILKTHFNIEHLSQLAHKDLEKVKEILSNELLFKRVRHVVSENSRVDQSIEALKNHHISRFGQLMLESHNSLKHDYEVTGIELDTLVSSAIEHGALGARVTGAGFGGCAIALVDDSLYGKWSQSVADDYLLTIGYETDIYPVDVVDGVCKL